jgi:hypothetical protein
MFESVSFVIKVDVMCKITYEDPNIVRVINQGEWDEWGL